MCRQVDMMARIADEKENWAISSSRSTIARADESARGWGQVHMSAGGVAGNGGSPAGRMNAALE